MVGNGVNKIKTDFDILFEIHPHLIDFYESKNFSQFDQFKGLHTEFIYYVSK